MNRRRGCAGLMRYWFGTIIVSIAFLQLISTPPSHAQTESPLVQLGRQLFFDTRLSSDDDLSCASCHIPEKAYTDGLPVARGHRGKMLSRNTPTLLHLREYLSFFWDGRSSTLQDQIIEVMNNPNEMNMSADELEKKLRRIPGYVEQFNKLFGTEITLSGVTRAIVAFEETLVTERAPFDRFMAGNPNSLNPSARRGLELFQNKGKCAFCHKGFNFTDSNFHNIGVPPRANDSGRRNNSNHDEGRMAVTGRAGDRGAFKTPTLRNIAQTAPYMHNGVFETLEEVIEFYNDGGGKNPNLDIQMEALRLTPREKKDLVAFLKALTGKYPVAKRPPLPGMD
jgi:cytochrome c peroxidase